MITRRRFLAGSLAGAALAACRSTAEKSKPTPAPAPAPPPAPRSILILGGTNFIGPHIVEAALAHGHKITLFNRGKTNPQLFPELEKLHGDRDGHLEALAGRKWDAVIDTSGFVPRIVRQSAELLAPNVGQYVFISTISVYPSQPTAGLDEDAPLATLSAPGSEDPRDYGANKALSEQAVAAALPGRAANLRPGLIVGPLDHTGRFTHWVTRLADGGEVLAPGGGGDLVQLIDSRDLAAWIVHVVETRTMGTYNALGPAGKLTMKELVDTCNHAGGDRSTVTWVDAAFLDAHGVTPWGDMPCWFAPEGDMAGFGTLSNARARAAGLGFRPLADTVADTRAWLATLPADEPDLAKIRSTGIPRDREAAVLAAWHARS